MATGPDAERALGFWREADPVQGEDVLATESRGEVQLAFHLPQLVGFKTNLHAGLGACLKTWRCTDTPVHKEVWGINLEEKK